MEGCDARQQKQMPRILQVTQEEQSKQSVEAMIPAYSGQGALAWSSMPGSRRTSGAV